MYPALLILHSGIRWLVVFSLAFSILIAFKGQQKSIAFTETANSMRHWTATFAHIELTIGVVLYTQSPIVKYLKQNNVESWNDSVFFGVVHPILMVLAVLIISIGSAKAKRLEADVDKYQTMFRYFLVGLIIIFIAIPWPFSPFAQRAFITLF